MIHSFSCPGPQLAFIGSGFSYVELLFIGMAVLVLFGPRKLPEIFRQFGSIMTQLRSASREFKMQVMDVENQIKEEVRDIERTIQKEAKALENDIEDGEFTMEDEHDSYSFEDDPYHADMQDDTYNHPDHEGYDHEVWADDHSDYDCPEDRARRELEAAAKTLTEGTEDAVPSIDDIPLEGSVPEGTVAADEAPRPQTTPENTEIPPGLETPVRRPPTGHETDQDTDLADGEDADSTQERSA